METVAGPTVAGPTERQGGPTVLIGEAEMGPPDPDPVPEPVAELLDHVAAAVERLADVVGSLTDRDESVASGLAEGQLQAFRGASARRGAMLGTRMGHLSDRVSVRAAGELIASGGFRHDASTTPARWLERHMGVTRREAQRLARVAALLESMPSLGAAFASGEVRLGHLDAIARIVPSRVRGEERVAMMEALGECTAELVTAAVGSDVARFEDFCARVRDRLDVDGPVDRAAEPSRVWLSKGIGGRWVLSGDLSADDGAVLADHLDRRTRRLLQAHTAASGEVAEPTATTESAELWGTDETADPAEAADVAEVADPAESAESAEAAEAADVAQAADVVMSEVRAQALLGLCGDGAAARAPGRVGLMLHVDLDDLRGMAEHPARVSLGSGTDISEATMWSLLADAQVRPVFWDGGQPLSYGRSRRLAPDILREILAFRDRECGLAGCRVPPPWHDAHHLRHWESGGATEPQGLKGCCGPHHRGHHRGQWRIRVDDGGDVVVDRPDGTPIDSEPRWSSDARRHDPVRARVVGRLAEVRRRRGRTAAAPERGGDVGRAPPRE